MKGASFCLILYCFYMDANKYVNIVKQKCTLNLSRCATFEIIKRLCKIQNLSIAMVIHFNS